MKTPAWMAVVRWWMLHPWAVLWLTTLATMVVLSNLELAFRPSRFLGPFIVFATVVGSVSFALGLRGTWQRSHVRAALIAACLALCSLFPFALALLDAARGKSVSFFAATQLVILSALIISGAVGLEYAARRRAIHELLSVPTANRGWRHAALLAGVLLAWIVGFLVYPAWKIGVARSRAESLCAAAVVGGPVGGLQAKGEDLGLAVWSYPARTGHPAAIDGWSGWIFARWSCTIEHEDGKVLGKRTYFLD